MAINYRLAPTHRFPAQLDDVRQALRYLVEHHRELSVDPDRIGLFGYSAGGHLALLAGLTDEDATNISDRKIGGPNTRVERSQNHTPERRTPKIRAIVAGGAVTDFRGVPEDAELFEYFLGGTQRERPSVYQAASPMAHVDADDPPTMLIHGGSDLVVRVEMSKQLAAQFERSGVEHELLVYQPLGHGLTFLHPGTAREATRFFASHLTD